MTADTIPAEAGVNPAGVAIGTSGSRMGASQRKSGGCVVIERRRSPGCRRVAQRTIGWKAGSRVLRVRGRIVSGKMAAAALFRRAREPVVRMALQAKQFGMPTGQDKSGLAVVENRTRPLGGCMTQRTILREPGGNMVRIFRVIEIGQVA